MPWLPFPVLASDVRDVVYLNWVVAADRAATLVPPGVELAERDGRVVLTILTYRHRHFGPALLGPLRRLFGSPRQSNWRFYVESLGGERPSSATVLFVANIFDSALYTIGTRLFSDALPSDLAGRFVHRRTGDGFETVIEGGGSAPELRSVTGDVADRILPPQFKLFFDDWEAAIAALCLQDAAICSVDDLPGRLALAEIALPIDVATVQPLLSVAESHGEWLDWLGVEGPPFCFCVPAVPFRVLSERLVAVS